MKQMNGLVHLPFRLQSMGWAIVFRAIGKQWFADGALFHSPQPASK